LLQVYQRRWNKTDLISSLSEEDTGKTANNFKPASLRHFQVGDYSYEVVLMKNREGQVIGLEKLNYLLSGTEGLSVDL